MNLCRRALWTLACSAALTGATLSETAHAGMCYAPDVLASGLNDPGPVAYWRLGDPGVIAFDAAPSPVLGVYFNSPAHPVAGVLIDNRDTAVDFDGVNDYVRFSDFPKLRIGGSFAIELWVKPHGTFQQQKYFLNKGNRYAVLFGYGPNHPDSVNFLAAAHGGFCDPGYPGGTAEISLEGETENWHHIVYTYNNTTTTWQGYKDGVLQFSVSCGFTLDQSSADPLHIGTSDPGAGTNNHVNSTIDEVALYDEYLPEAQVVAHYNNAFASNSPLRFEAAHTPGSGAPGLNGAQGVATSPDGANVYAVGGLDDSIVEFDRSPSAGALTFGAQKDDGVGGIDGLNGAYGVTVSGDGKSVYVTASAEHKLARFDRGVGGSLSQNIGYVIEDGVGGGTGGTTDGLDTPRGVVVSPDGKSIYVGASGDDSVALFVRDTVTGAITDFAQVVKDSSNGLLGLNGAWAVAVSPDNAHVYVAADVEDALTVFSRNTTTGILTRIQTLRDTSGGSPDGLNGARSVTISPDGKHVYVAGKGDDAIALFVRATSGGTFGQLTYGGMVKDGVGGVDGLNGATSVACNSTGTYVYASGELEDSIAVFSRNATTGALTFLEREKNAVQDNTDCAATTDGLNATRFVTVSPDSADVYSTGYTDDAVTAFSAW